MQQRIHNIKKRNKKSWQKYMYIRISPYKTPDFQFNELFTKKK